MIDGFALNNVFASNNGFASVRQNVTESSLLRGGKKSRQNKTFTQHTDFPAIVYKAGGIRGAVQFLIGWYILTQHGFTFVRRYVELVVQ